MKFTIKISRDSFNDKSSISTEYRSPTSLGPSEGVKSDINNAKVSKSRADKDNDNTSFLGDSKQFFNSSSLITGATLSAGILIDRLHNDSVTANLDTLETFTTIGGALVTTIATKSAITGLRSLTSISSAIPGPLDDIIIGAAVIGAELGIASLFNKEKARLKATVEIRNERFSRRLNGIRISSTY